MPLTAVRSRRRPRTSRSRRLFVEHLEDRRLLTTRMWTGNGVNDLWSNAANWDGGLTVPVNGDDVIIAATANSAEVLFDGTAAAVSLNSLSSDEPFHITGSALALDGAGTFSMTAGLTLDGGDLGGTGTLTVSGTTSWTGGNLDGGGTLVIPSGAALNISGNSQRFMFGHTINNSGTVAWTGTANIRIDNNPSVINNQSGGVFNAQNDGLMNNNSSTLTFNNQSGAIFNKSGAGTTSTFSVTFNNDAGGTVNVNSGTLELGAGGTDGGAFVVALGGTLNFSGGTHTLGATSSITGAGDVTVTGATVNVGGTYNITGNTNISSGNGNFTPAATASTTILNLSGGTLGGSGTLTATGTSSWTGGNMDGGGTLAIASGGSLNISGTTQRFLNGHTINNSGTITWTDAANIRIDNSPSVINNQSGGVFNAQNDGLMNNNSSTLTFNNQSGATFNKSGAGTTSTFNVAFNNDASAGAIPAGAVNVNSGTLELGAGGTDGGAFNVASGGTLNFSGGTHTLGATSSVSGAGDVTFTGATVNEGGIYTITGNTKISSGSANFNATATTTAASLSAGNLGGSGTLTVSGTMNWTGGNMDGGGTLAIASGGSLNISGTTQRFLNGHTINNSGTVTWTGTANIRIDNNPSVINNQSGGVFNAQNDGLMNNNSSTLTFNNQSGAIFNKSVSGTTSTFQVTFNNDAAVNVITGALVLAAGGTSGGTFNVPDGGTLTFSGGTHDLTATSSVTGAGDVNFSGATVNVGGTYNILDNTSISGGAANFSSTATATAVFVFFSGGALGGSGTLTVNTTMSWMGGNLADNGTLAIASGASLNISSNSQRFMFGHTINNSGTVTWTGTANIRIDNNPSVINNQSGGVFNAQNDGLMNNNSSTLTFNNQSGATFNKSGAGTTSTFAVAFNNAGTINVNSGTLQFGSTFTQTAGATQLSGGSISTSTSLDIQGGILDGNGTVTGNVNNSGGTLSPGTSPGLITIDGNYVQTDGTPPSGELSVEIGGLMAVTDYDQVIISGTGHSATLAGTLTVTLINGFVPSIGDSFTILSGTASGAFDTENLPPLPPDRQWQVTIGSVVLTVVPAVSTCQVINTNDSGAGSLRQAIIDANNNAGLDTICFNIPGSGVHTITPATQLPTISGPIFIDGYTQPKNDGSGTTATKNTLATADNAVLLIEISGATVSNNGNGLVIDTGASGSTISGLVIDNGWSAGILVLATNTVIEGNFIGTDPTGLVAHGVTQGVNFQFGADTSGSRVGGTTPAARNILSGNGTGVIIQGGSGHLVQGNFIGVDATGAAALPNGTGVDLRSAGAQVGDGTVAGRNVIAGGGGVGIDVNSLLSGSLIQGNFIGTDATGTKGLGLTTGIRVQNGGAQIGGATGTPGTGLGNVINARQSGFSISNGISVSNNVSNVKIQGNLIGTDVTGTNVFGFLAEAVVISGPANTVGSDLDGMDDAAEGNIIAGGLRGITVGNNNVQIHSGTIANNIITGNGLSGVEIPDGGTTGIAVLGNSIFANGGLGIDLGGNGVTANDDDSPPCTTGQPDCDTGPNNFQNYPVLTSAVTTAGVTTITGTLNSTPSSDFRVEFFSNMTADPSLHGEGQTFLGFTNVTTDTNGDASFSFSPATALTGGLFVSATATKREDTDQNDQTPLAPTDTSEFAADVCSADQFTVVNTNDSGAGSLRQAILNANSNVGITDTITFCISGTGVHTISPLTELPTITDPVIIDGYTQPGASANTHAMTDPDPSDNAVLLIELDGSSATAGASGLVITAGSSTVRGLVINGFNSASDTSGITLQTGGGNTITGNFIGTDPAGAVARANGSGLDIIDSANNIIGGTTPDARNLFSANTTEQLLISGTSASGNQIMGNFVGPNAAGNASLSVAGDRSEGITVRANNNTIGGTAAGAGNVISGNANDGIFLNIVQGTIIQGNFIGTDASGLLANSNGVGGIDGVAAIDIGGGSNNIIGGTTAGSRNVIAGNTAPGMEEGILVDASQTTIQGNFIGVNVLGNALGNAGPGILAQSGTNNAIGGTAAGAGNTIAFNAQGVEVRGSTTGNAILSNSIFSNSPGLGIDLHNGFSSDGATPNDLTPTQDADAGPNNFQNFPVMTAANLSGGQLTIVYNVPSDPANSTYPLRVEFFKADGDGQEGQTFLGFDTFNAADFVAGSKTFMFTPAVSVASGDKIVATATDMRAAVTAGSIGVLGLAPLTVPNNTSEFSAPVTVVGVAAGADLSVAKSVSNPTPNVGNTITFTVTLTDAGPDAATNVTLTDLLPAGLTFVSASPSQGTYNSATGVWTVGTVTTATPQTLQIQATVASSGSRTNTASVTHSDQADANTANNSASATETPQRADLSVAKAVSNPTPNVGDTITFTVTLTDAGPDPATNVTLTDLLPAGLTFVSASPSQGSYNSATGVWTVGTVTTTTPQTLQIQATVVSSSARTNTASVSHSDQFDANTANNSASATETPQRADLSVAKTVSNPTPNVGDTVTFTITLTDAGPNPATNVTLADLLPSGLTFVSASPSQGSYNSATGVWTVGTVTTTVPQTLQIQATAASAGSRTNTASVSHSDQFDPSTANNSASATITAQNNTTDLSVTKTDSPDPVTAGQNLTYTITVNNAGGAASGVSLSDAVPTGTTFVSATQTAGPTFTLSKPSVGGGGTLSGTIASLAAGATATFTLVVHVRPSTATGSTISNTVSVSSTTADTNTANNSDTETTSVVTLADISLAKTDSPDPVAPGAVLTYTIVVSNLGPSDAQGISLTDTIPANTTFVSFTPPAGWMFTNVAGVITATDPTLPAGASATFTLVVAVDSTAPIGTTITNTASATTSTTESSTANNSSTAETEVNLGLPECDISTLNEPGNPGTAVIAADADNPGGNVLIITGTSRGDVIVVEPQPKSQGLMRVVENKHVIVTFISRDVQRIVIFGLQGNDKITVSGALLQPATIFGGAGNDVIVAGSGDTQISGGDGSDKIVGGRGNDALCGDNGNDVIVGGLGNDTIFGEAGNDVINGSLGDDLLIGGDGNDTLDGAVGNDHLYGQAGNDTIIGGVGNNILVGGDGNDKIVARPGRNILIGGTGRDKLYGSAFDDILIAGSTAHDEDDAALQAILDEWTSAHGYATRVSNIRNGGGANGAFVFDDTTVTDDTVTDTLIGDGGLDWFWIGVGDKIKDRAKNEIVN